jgi:hypothetical protein
MSCDRLLHIDDKGSRVTQPKFKFNTMDEAIKVAKDMNLGGKNIHKVVAYKCPKCCKYHIGKNKTKLDANKIKPHWK